MSGFLSFRPEPFVWPTESEWEVEASRTGPDYIRWVQSSLNRVMGLRLAVDGIMGPATRSAVRSFQQRKGLAVDGIVGPNTEAALIAAGAPRLLDSSSAAQSAGLPSYIPARGPSGAAPPVASHAPRNLFEICQVLDNFDLDKYTLKPEHLAKIVEIADQIMQSQHTHRPIRSVKIVGHTDPSGPSEYNRQLGLNRATAVKIKLDGLLRGVKPTIDSRVQSRGEAPIRGISDPAKLRRVDVCLQYLQSTPPVKTLPTVNYCGPSQWGDVFSHWRAALDSVARANDRLRLLKVVNRASAWYRGPEHIWFGKYTKDHFENLTRNMQQIYEILSDPKLTITCDPKLKPYGSAFPGIRRIKLGSLWKNEKRPHERTQTLVHEAAHIAGLVTIPERRKSGPACAKRLAQQNCFKAMRNADNYGYYALHQIGEYQTANPNNCPINYFPLRTCR